MTKIEKLRQKYKDMWLAIKVTKRDDEGGVIEGELIAKSNDHDEIRDIAPINKEYSTFITFTGPALKKDMLLHFLIKKNEDKSKHEYNKNSGNIIWQKRVFGYYRSIRHRSIIPDDSMGCCRKIGV